MGVWDAAAEAVGVDPNLPQDIWNGAASGVAAAGSAAKDLWGRVTSPVAGQDGVSGDTSGDAGTLHGQAGTNVNASGRPIGYQATGTATGKPGETAVKGSASTDVNGVPVTASGQAQAPVANAGVGSFTDASGQQSTGARAEASTGKMEGQVKTPDGSAGGEVQGPGAWAGASDNGSTFEAGASAQVASAAANVGTTGTNSDENLKVGASEGVGAAARFHHGDADGDKRTEWGVGVDVGPVSVNLKTEDPLKTMATANPVTMPLAAAARAVQGAMGDDTNWTEAAGNAASAVGDKAATTGAEAWDAAKTFGKDMGSAASDLWNGMF